MLNWCKRLFRPKKPAYPQPCNVFASADIHITPSSETRINIKFGEAIPVDRRGISLCAFVLCQAVNIRVNLVTEPALIQQAYPEMMADILDHWPESSVRHSGDFIHSLAYFRRLVESHTLQDMRGAIKGGEEIELVLAERADGNIYLFDYYPGMPGCGPPGLAINLVHHYMYLVDHVLYLLSNEAAQRLGNALSELWLMRLRLPFDTLQPINRSELYREALIILENNNLISGP